MKNDPHPKTHLRFLSWRDHKSGLEVTRIQEKPRDSKEWPPLPPHDVLIETGYQRESRTMRR